MAVFRKAQSLTMVLLFFCHAVFAQQDWEARAEANTQRLIAKNGTGRDLQLRRDLLKMRDDDQGIRNTGATRQKRRNLPSPRRWNRRTSG
jgi:hypothetical protein